MPFTNLKYLIFLLPILAIATFLLYRKITIQTTFNQSPLARMRNYRHSNILTLVRNIALISCLVLLFISILRPTWGTKMINTEAKGIDVVFTLDVSKSMKALDMSVGGQETDRLTLAKAMIGDFVTNNPTNRYGLIIFAGNAFVSVPLTLDHSAFITFLRGVDYDDVESQGTDLDEALKASIDRFYSEQDKERGRSVVLISDGGEEMTGDISGFKKVTDELGIKIFTIGVGSKKDTPIPEGRDFFGKIVYKSFQGKTVMTKLNEKPLQKIAKETDGEYFHADKQDDLKKISEELSTLQSTVIERAQAGSREDQYQIFLALSFLCFVVYLFTGMNMKVILNIKELDIKSLKRFLPLLFLSFMLSGCSGNETLFRYHNNEGNKAFAQSYIKEAKADYQKAGTYSRDNKYIADNNSGIVDYEQGEYNDSVKKLESAIFVNCAENPEEYCDQLYYNLGNNYYRLGEANAEKQSEYWQQAVEQYQKTLELNPEDTEAQENIDFIMNKLNEQNEEQNQEGQEGESGEDQSGEQNSEENSQSGENDESGESGEQGENSETGESESASASPSAEDSKDEEGTTDEENDSASAEATADKEGENGEENGQTGQAEEAQPELDQETDQKIEQYLQQMEEQEARNQDYLRRNPDAMNNNEANFFSDPFFDRFFGRTGSNNFNNQGEANEIDW